MCQKKLGLCEGRAPEENVEGQKFTNPPSSILPQNKHEKSVMEIQIKTFLESILLGSKSYVLSSYQQPSKPKEAPSDSRHIVPNSH